MCHLDTFGISLVICGTFNNNSRVHLMKTDILVIYLPKTFFFFIGFYNQSSE